MADKTRRGGPTGPRAAPVVDMLPRRNVLIFHAGALGDFVLTWPLALALGRLFPQSRIFYVTHSQKGRLAERVLGVESADVDGGGWHQLFVDSPKLPDASARLLAGARSVVTFVSGPDSAWTRNVRAINPEAQVVSLSQNAPPEFAGHVTDHLVDQLAAEPAWTEAVRQILRSVAQRGVPAVQPGTTPVLHPGSGGRHKCWPADRFLALASRLAAGGARPRVVVGEVEQELWKPAEIDAFAAVADVVRPPDLLGLLQSLAGASVFVGNDTGPGHLAGVLGLPTVSLFGPTDPTRWRPLGPRVRVIQRPAMGDIEVDEVEAAVREVSA